METNIWNVEYVVVKSDPWVLIYSGFRMGQREKELEVTVEIKICCAIEYVLCRVAIDDNKLDKF